MDLKKYLTGQIRRCRRKMNIAKLLDKGVLFADNEHKLLYIMYRYYFHGSKSFFHSVIQDAQWIYARFTGG